MDDILTYLKAMLEWWWLYLTGGPESLWVTFRVFDLDELGHPKVEMSYYFENLGQSAIIIEDVSLIIAVAKDKSADWEKNFLLCRPPNIPHPQFMSMYPDNVKYTATNAGR